MYTYICVYVYVYIYTYMYVYVCVCVFHIFFIHSCGAGHLGGFHILAIVNSATNEPGGACTFGINVFIFFEYISRSGIAG